MATEATATRVVGRGVRRVDSPERVTGKAVYGADLTLPGTLHAKVLRSPHPHARIKSINVAKALKMPGVRVVVTGADYPPVDLSGPVVGGEIAMSPRDQRRMQLAEDVAFYYGHAVAAVAATDVHTAEEALKLIEVDYEPLPPVLDIEQAIARGAPLVHSDLYTWEFPGEYATMPSNIFRHIEMGRGDVEKGFAEADIVIERTVRGGTVHQGYIEPQACTVDIDANGHLTIHTSSQINFNLRDALTTILGLSESEVTVVPLEIGGGFGGKAGVGIELITCLLAMKAGHPVKLVLTREEVFHATGPTCPHLVTVKVGARRDGTLTAFQGTYYLDAGAVAGFTHSATAAMTGASHYKVANLHIDTYDVVTNKPVAMAYRAPSGPIGNWPTEVVMDELAERLGMDPVDLRLKNVAEEGDPLPNGLRMPVWGLKKILETVKQHPSWTDPVPPGRGRGFACGYWSSAGLTSSAEIVVNGDGTFSLTIGSVDLTGVRTTMTQIAAEELGVDMGQVRVGMGNTDSVGHTDGSFGSRTTRTTGIAVQNAAREAIRRLKEHAAQMLGVGPDAVEYGNQTFVRKGDPARKISLKEVCGHAVDAGGAIQIVGTSSGLPNAPASAASVAEVEVDRETGRVEVTRFTIFQDPGRAINPMAVEGQMQGGASQGIGWALWEVYDWKDGVVRNANLLDYRIPTSLDLPMIEAVIVETPDPNGPYGARGVGEIPIVTPVAATANAIHDATSIRLWETPFAPERVMWELQEQAKANRR